MKARDWAVLGIRLMSIAIGIRAVRNLISTVDVLAQSVGNPYSRSDAIGVVLYAVAAFVMFVRAEGIAGRVLRSTDSDSIPTGISLRHAAAIGFAVSGLGLALITIESVVSNFLQLFVADDFPATGLPSRRSYSMTYFVAGLATMGAGLLMFFGAHRLAARFEESPEESP